MAMPAPGGIGFDPSSYLEGWFPWTDLSKWGEYGPAISSILDLLRGPNIPAMAGASTATGIVEPAAQKYQETVQQGQAALGSRGLTGSGPSQSLISDALNQLQGSEVQGATARTNVTQQLRSQLQQMIMSQLANISTGRAQGQQAVQGANLNLQAATNANQAQNAGILGDIFGNGLSLLTSPLSSFLPAPTSLLGFGGSGAFDWLSGQAGPFKQLFE